MPDNEPSRPTPAEIEAERLAVRERGERIAQQLVDNLNRQFKQRPGPPEKSPQGPMLVIPTDATPELRKRLTSKWLAKVAALREQNAKNQSPESSDPERDAT